MELQSTQSLGVTCDRRQSVFPEPALDKALVFGGNNNREKGTIKIAPKCQALEHRFAFFRPWHFGTISNFHLGTPTTPSARL